MKARKRMAALLALLMLLALLCGCSAEKKSETAAGINSLEDLTGKKIGTITGANFDTIVPNHVKDPQLEYYNSATDASVALEAGKVDAYVVDEPVAQLLMQKYPTQRILTKLTEEDYAFLIGRTEKREMLLEQVNAFLSKLREDGTLDELKSIWLGSDREKQVVDFSGLTAENGTLSFVTTTSGTGAPFTYIQDGQFCGYDVDIAVRFCREHGYGISIMDVDIAGMLGALDSGKADFGAASVAATEERRQSGLLFTDPDYKGGVVLVVKDGSAPAETPVQSGYSSIEDLAGKRIAVLTGSVFDAAVSNSVKDPQLVYVNAGTDACVALETGKADAYATDEPTALLMLNEYPTHRILQMISKEDYAFVIGQTDKRETIHAQLNEFLAKLREDGTMEELRAAWIGQDAEKQVIDYSGLTGENGTLIFATSTTGVGAPFTYIQDGQFCGYDVDIAVRFCREYGYGIEIQDMAFDGVLASMSSGKADFAACCVAVTEERRQSGLLFSDPDYKGGIVLVVKDGPAPAETPVQSGCSSIEDLAGKRIAVLTGAVFDSVVLDNVKDPQLVYVNTSTDACVALDTGKADAYATSEPTALLMQSEYPTHRILQMIAKEDYAFVIGQTNKRETIRAQINEYLAKLREDGTLDEIKAAWIGKDAGKQDIDYSGLTGENGTLIFVTSTAGVGAPFAYIKDGQFCGYDVDIAVRFCREYGYGIEIQDMTFDGMLASIASGKADFGACCVTVTEERKQSGILFSDPNYTGGVVVVVKDTSTPTETATQPGDGSVGKPTEQTGGGIRESFEKTFIREGRWKLFASGIGITLLITVLSVIFGTAAGFLLFLVYRKGNRAFVGILDILMEILEKTPVVVILMILYYIIFGKSDLKGAWVAVIGFSILFACSFIRTVDIGVHAVDRGQTEASLALGFTDTKAFLTVILPQAARHFLPNYRGNIVSLLKDTAVVGYIAVQDLTKVGDIIRSRTYEAFFPLIATAVIYFLLAWLLAQLVKRVEFDFDPKNRSAEKVLKGVKTK